MTAIQQVWKRARKHVTRTEGVAVHCQSGRMGLFVALYANILASYIEQSGTYFTLSYRYVCLSGAVDPCFRKSQEV
jgi:hypothetical protein